MLKSTYVKCYDSGSVVKWHEVSRFGTYRFDRLEGWIAGVRLSRSTYFEMRLLVELFALLFVAVTPISYFNWVLVFRESSNKGINFTGDYLHFASLMNKLSLNLFLYHWMRLSSQLEYIKESAFKPIQSTYFNSGSTHRHV